MGEKNENHSSIINLRINYRSNQVNPKKILNCQSLKILLSESLSFPLKTCRNDTYEVWWTHRTGQFLMDILGEPAP